MNRQERKRIIERLEARHGLQNQVVETRDAIHSEPSQSDDGVHHAMRRIVDAGAARFGIRVDEAVPGSISACELAPPLARMIDHTALKAETSEKQIRQLCAEARQFCFASVCVNPCYVDVAADELSGSDIAVCTVIGFPLGATTSFVKGAEGQQAIRDGASELDMVVNVGFLKSQRYGDVERDVQSVVDAARGMSTPERPILVKVILETALLTDEEKVIACVLAQNAGADYVKTSTGFSTGGATAADVALMRRVVGAGMGVKASGGVRSREDAEAMIAHGATRIGASASVEIVRNIAASSDKTY
ncbi:MAG: deoxyribose-phosphate aldolase [Rhodothermales bacterium]